MNEDQPMKINAGALYKLITKEMVYEAISYITANSIALEDAAKYYLLINNDAFPPKEVVRIIAKLNNYDLNDGSLNGGQANKPFEDLGFQIIDKKDYPVFNGSRFSPQISKYQKLIDHTDWLAKHEGYKFNFCKWFEQNIHLDEQTNEEIIAKINESQELNFQPNSKEKGVNFIKSIKRFNNDFITADDLDKIRKIIKKEIPVNKENITFSFNSYTKSSVYLNLFSPNEFNFYDSKSSPSYKFLSERTDYPKKDFKSFYFNQIFYKNIKTLLKESHLNTDVFKTILKVDELNELHWNFITQDFLYFIATKIMKKETLQNKYDVFVEQEDLENDDWYIRLKKYTEILNTLRDNCIENKYTNYNDLNQDFKKLANDDREDFLQRYLFESNNGFSKIRNQLIENQNREIIRNKISTNFSLLNEIIVCTDKKETFKKIHLLIDTNKWAVITRFTRALFPFDFTSVDTYWFLNLLVKKLKNEFDIEFDTKDQIDLNEQIINLIEYDDIYKAQIFFWYYTKETYDLDKLDDNEVNEESTEYELNTKPMKNIYPLNQILFGAPGTGKTHETKKLAVEIIENQKLDHLTREEITTLYDQYYASGQINFTTFHQSISYEDFIEGIKPQIVLDDNNSKSVVYDIEDGIFKKMCKIATATTLSIGDEIGKYVIKNITNDLIFLESQKSFSLIPIPYYLVNELCELVCKGELTLEDIKTKNAVDKMSPTTEKYIVNGYPYIFELLVKTIIEKKEIKHLPHVLIIDEINRGNVSAIFGELITLIEDTKRKGTITTNKEAIEVELPYSKEKFSVPDNLFIIGTMNTADRSVEALDTALRRRFSFVEMKSKPEILTEYHPTKGILKIEDGTEINLIELLDKINKRIEILIDKDHQIGHSFFIHVTSLDELKNVFKNKINPLLEEYFYGNFAKIGLVLGKQFIEEVQREQDIFADFDYDDQAFLAEKKIYQLKDTSNLKAEDFESIYSKK